MGKTLNKIGQQRASEEKNGKSEHLFLNKMAKSEHFKKKKIRMATIWRGRFMIQVIKNAHLMAFIVFILMTI